MKFWLSRDKYGTLVLWSIKPTKIGELWYGTSNFILDSYYSPTFGKVILFPEVTVENSPQQVELKLL